MERGGDVERADLDPEIYVDPYTINSCDTIGANVDIMITDVERAIYANPHGDRTTEDAGYEEPNRAEEFVDHTAREEKRNVLIVVSYEGDLDPMDPHNWPVLRRLAYTTLISLLGALTLFSSTIDPPALTETTQVFHTTFEVQSLPTGRFSCV